MASEDKFTVGDYVTLQRGTTYSGELVGEPGPPLLGLGSIEPGGGFRSSGFKTFGGDCPPALMVRPGETYVALKGATKDGSMVGSVARLPRGLPAGRLTQDTARMDFLDPDPDVATHVYWVLRTPEYRAYCAGRLTGSAAASFSRSDLLAYPVPPITRVRRALVRLLDAIEDKIELNREMVETLEATARALFKSKLVDLDPVRAKSEGLDPSQPKRVADIVPDRFMDSKLGEIPAGWNVVGLDAIARFRNGLALQKFPPTHGKSLPVIKIAQLHSGNTDGADLASGDLAPDFIVEDGDVLFSWSGSLECVLWAGGPGALNQHLFKVTSSTYPKWFYYFWIHEHLDDFRAVAAGKATTMGHIQRHHLSQAMVVVPPAPTLEMLDPIIGPLFESMWRLAVQSRTLGEIRDVLLPRLTSGELRIPEAGPRVEAVPV